MTMTYEDDKKAAVDALTKIDPKKPLGTELFNAILRVSIGVAIVAVSIRRNATNGLEVLLAWRNETAPAHRNTWHCPGTFLRPAESEDEAIERLAKNELGCRARIIKKVGWDDNPHEERGHCIHPIFLVELTGESRGKWFSVNNLPPETVEHHRQVIIPMAVEAFLR